ncbi:hypothetical protein [Salisaeta longa]|uniref:hypothetical protein n=1 Tax=Salisaeta longa TaxID=503170 RepID=UPI0004194CB0|nr:hypothetical protein [Salisaeta longa]
MPSSPDDAANESSTSSQWIVRLMLLLAFGLAFAIEGRTLFLTIKNELFGDGPPPADTTAAATVPTVAPGDELLPASPAQEVVRLQAVNARSDGPWTFRFVVAVRNDSLAGYALTLGPVVTTEGDTLRQTVRRAVAAGDTARVRGRWTLVTGDRPQALTATVQFRRDGTLQTVTRRVVLGRVPVRMTQRWRRLAPPERRM